jgi:hypothetical protein
MKGKFLGIVIITLAATLFLSVPVWSTENQAEETAPAATEEKTMEKTETATPAPEAQSSIQIEEAVVCQDVVDRTPVGSGDVFAKETQKVYCFSRVVGAAGETQVTHNWYYKGTLKSSVKLTVRSNNWRTWSSKTMMPEWTGEWMVEILSEEGTPLESIIFFMQ